MRILYLHQYFKTPEEGGPIRSYYLGQALVQAGHQVVMLTSWNGKHTKKELVDGIEVHYLPVPYNNQMSARQRMSAFLDFLRQARRQLAKLVPADLVYATSTPLTIGLLALYLRRRWGIPYIFEVRDLWPEAPIQMGALQNPLLVQSLRLLEKRVYQKAAALVALSPGISEGIYQQHIKARIELAPNMADTHYFIPGPKPEALLKQWDLEGKFVISYTGAAGAANRLEYLLAAARACLAQQLPVRFLIASAGGRLEAIRQQAEGLSNVLFLPYANKKGVRDYLAVSDAIYVSFGPEPVLESCSPNKFFDGLAAGKLCILNTEGWLKGVVLGNGCGFWANPLQPEHFVAQLRPYLQDRQLLQQAQANARQTAEQHFSRQQISARVVALVEKVAAQR